MEDQKSLTSSKQELPPLVAMMPSPGMGHLIPLIEFAKRLVRHYDVPVTFLIPTAGPPSKAETAVISSISHVFLPPVTLSDLPPGAKAETLMSHTIYRSLPSLRQTLISLMASHRVSALVIDLFGTDAFDVAAELNLPAYLYFPSTANSLSFSLYLPYLDQQVQCEFRDLPDLVKIPGGVPVHGRDLNDACQDRNAEVYKCFLHHTKRYTLATGIIENSFLELEPEAIKFLQTEEPGRPPVYPVGPLVNEDSARTVVDGAAEECLRWLDEQPRGSVIFVSFGSRGFLSSGQIDELAFGLEMSEQRFLWVVRCPNDKVANTSKFNADSQGDPFDFLPKGFMERTKGRGLVVPNWAPQAQVLNHASTGGFLTHCGWNSVLESVVNGVPLVAWPLYAEQRMNAVLLTQARVALRPKIGENGLVERQEIASIVKILMEGDEGKKLRHRMNNLKVAAAAALKEDGTSTKQIRELALKWKGGETTVSN